MSDEKTGFRVQCLDGKKVIYESEGHRGYDDAADEAKIRRDFAKLFNCADKVQVVFGSSFIEEFYDKGA